MKKIHLLPVNTNWVFKVFCIIMLIIQGSALNAKDIKLAILLDTSNSMDGLIDQARSQLWTIVNKMAGAKCDNAAVNLQIALYEYGNSGLPMDEGYIRMVTPLTNDLDQLSEDLFSLRTNGGQEYCGMVIETSLKELSWNDSREDYQVIFIAGNEPFTQGNTDYKQVCQKAKSNGIIVNTIFCGNFNEGATTGWKNGAIMTGGEYFSIEQDKKTIHIPSPWDDKIIRLNNQLNTTYIYYGKKGVESKMKQEQQDMNASQFGAANSVKRAVSKSSHVYKNAQWDLVDAASESEFDVSEVETDYLPEEMKAMNDEEKEQFISEKKGEREKIKSEIALLNKKREAFVQEKRTETGQGNTLDNAIIMSITKQAGDKNFNF